ncbi:hypothetical protein ABGB18_42525 [Nonomuraea sp. B12E4]|uniref:hypothetical protein n=1 Tax=Nonomuraea sp. B12E4 TaxID=3153564 RepID=UPI00325C793C
MRPDRYRVIVNDHSAKSTATKRSAEGWAKLARGHGMSAHVEATNVCPTCGLHGCPQGAACPDAAEAK